ncbi:MAG: phosphoketolase family protein [Candidatus Dormibacteraeota bacterium]|uniref:Phosphoketolase family protein n=1 Tax=Candidatus Amunia macphersoniae TaxID=3127014 RepID=A0A934KM39_9BACT|nr:phosphoketolase family protein [Candidatus Dormibacteraeota bacterium]
MTTVGSIDVEALLTHWRAANYLTVAQIYLQDNPLLREPLAPVHIKPRLLGHWGTSPGLNLVYTQLNRLIQQRDCDVIYVTGPGHGGPAIVANVYLEGTYSEIYPRITLDESGLRRLVRQFSTPGGIPSHVSVPTPGSIHEGGELGYALVHAFGAAFDNPDLLVACVVGDGEAETGPLEGSWKSIRFLNPVRDGAVLPILHLNGYKISGPTVLGRASDDEVRGLLHAHGYDVRTVSGEDPGVVHEQFAHTLDTCYERIREIQADARSHGFSDRPRWPAIVLRTPKGWTGPAVVDGLPVEGTFRAHQVPLANVRDDPEHLQQLESWMRGYAPERLFDGHGRPVARVTELIPRGDKRMGASPHANGGRLLRPLQLPDVGAYAIAVTPGVTVAESTRRLGEVLRDSYRDNPNNFRLFCPDETNSNRLGAVFDDENRCLVERIIPIDDHVRQDGRVMEVLSEHLCEGWLEGYLLTGRHGLFATYEAFAMVSASMTVQHTKWLEAARGLQWRAPVASLNVLLTSTCWRNDHNGFSHQGPGLIDTMISMSGDVVRVYLPPDANCLLSVADHCLRSRNYVNLIVIDKQPELQYLSMDDATAHCARGASIWEWASNTENQQPDVVLGCAGDIPTLETLAAAALLREHVPELRVQLVNVVDLLALTPAPVNAHSLTSDVFAALFTEDVDVVMAFHGYARAFHQVVHGRPNAARFHVHGFSEQGTTTTPFDMVVLNEMSRYHLALEALQRLKRVPDGVAQLELHCHTMLERHHRYVREHFADMPEISSWRWPG